MSRIKPVLFVLILCVLTIVATSIWAYWIQDGAPICTATGMQENPAITFDGADGAIVTWQDYRSGGNYDIYVQWMDGAGIVQWTTDGVALCQATGAQELPGIVNDGSGGAIVMWEDNRSGNRDIYAQRVDGAGTARWMTDGVAVCTAAGPQYGPTILSDGAGGTIVTWYDYRGSDYDVYVQRLDAAGTSRWTADGAPLCTETGHQVCPEIVSDGAGGAIVTWYDYRSGNYDIYAQRVNSAGTVQWTADGVAVCTETGDQRHPVIVPDGAGGVIITWEDIRGGNYDIYAQRVDAAGAVEWTTGGVAICTAILGQYSPRIAPDGAGGAIVTWADGRGGNNDIYAQRVDAAGTVQWTTDGVALCTATDYQYSPEIASDGAGGAIVTWYDYRGGVFDIYAQRVDATGTVQWTPDGSAVCAAAGGQDLPKIVSDGVGGAVIAWQDYRNGNYDIFAQRIDRKGRKGFLGPDIHAVRDVPGDQGGSVYLSWYAAPADITSSGISHYSVWRAISSTAAALALENGVSSVEDLSELAADIESRVILRETNGSLTYFWELLETVDALFMEAYGKTVPTLFDSTIECSEYHYFQVVAHTSEPSVYWTSGPDSGYSVDNLSPGQPLAIAAEQSFSPEGLRITWDPNTETDLKGYAIYRDLSSDFVPGPGNFLAAPFDTAYFDSDWSWDGVYYYKLAAVDIHGNESDYALLEPDQVTGGDTPVTPTASYLSQNYPNPFNPSTSIEFGLSSPTHVTLAIYDPAGRLVRLLVEETRNAGHHVEEWDGRDEMGRAAASGVYFYRLNMDRFDQTRKMILLR